ncbi:hypothetical protein DMB65_11225 [Flavobacterium cheongpyeongense]|uniref:Uncharacterized protein n=1 Tax=Flavobacterium cheongpyeongense TaxID=2212651 RepID=A0A2V4BSH2_9FLAO|nr:hypothetical protein [Flavobacterium cheongpyeongense]PXY40793.1 hypothetical protein DMB65_11225 [Flavobacterium cheongpyeongense]
MKTHITYNKFIYNDHENAQLYFQQNFQGGFLDPDAAIVIEKAINQLLKRTISLEMKIFLMMIKQSVKKNM